MKIDKSKLRMGIWYEDENGNRIEYNDKTSCNAPANAQTVHILFPLEVNEEIFALHEYDGRRTYRGSDLIGRFGTTIGGDGNHLVQMANSGDYTLKEAIAIYAQCCERCANALIWKYSNGEDGYPEYSDEWYKANTYCDFCLEEENADNSRPE